MHHPILQSLTLSEAQTRAAFGPTDVLVTAGAGAGKTWALTARFLALLAAGLPLRGIVAITFTRKAAREMRKRIREQVWAYLARPDLEPAERERWHAIASQLDAARISTIHSLCQEILRAHPVEARVDPDFQVIEEGRMALLKREAVEDALFWAANQAELAGLFAQVGESEVRGALSALLQQGVDARALLASMPHHPDALLAAWETELARMQRARLAEIMADPDWQAARAAIEQARIRVPSDKLSMLVQTAREALQWLSDRQDADALRRAAALLGGIKNYSRVGTAKAWPEGKTAIQQALKTLREPFFGKENAWLSMGLNEEDARSARALAALRAVALQAFAIYEARKGEAHALDFDDLETRAVSLLEDHPSVRRRWREEVQALLVDEFQDTNARQARLLELLDGGRGVRFLVGDAKQSIYRFRGAEVAVFTRTEGDFEAAGKRVARLNATYRAHARLVDGLNDLLEPVLGRARYDWEAAFAPLTSARDRAPRIASDAFIEVQLAAGNKGEAMPIAARAAVNRLIALFDQGYAPGDAAILCRAATSFAAYEDALDAAGVPFLTLAGRGFFQRPEIRDLTNVMRAAADPTDDVALVGALRSPGLGLSDVALYHLARHRERLRQTSNVKRHDLWTAVQTPPHDFPPDELPRLTFARELLTRLHGMAGRAPVADLLKGYVDETDYLAILAGAGQSRAVRNVNKLLADVQAAGLVHMASFLEWIDLARDADVREGEAPVVAEGAVQIMTVHRAKGLEFPIVVLGDITYAPRRGRGVVIADGWMAWKVPSSSENEAKPAFYQLLQRMEARKEEAEDKRLFYVAATRAEDHLILNGVVGRWNKGGWYRWLKLALPELDAFVQAEGAGEQICRLGMAGAPVRCVRVEDAAAPRRTYTPETDALAPPPFQPKLLAPFEPVEDALDEDARQREQEPERRVWRIFPPEGARAWAPAWMVGKLAHRAIELERMPDAPNFDAWLEASARGLGLSDPGMIRNALWRTRRLLRNLAASALWAEIQAADQRLHEVPYAYLDPDGVPARGTIDLLYRTGEDWTLVDFKTDRARDRAEMEAIIAEKGYDEQVRRYAEAVRALLDVTPRAVVCFLDVAGEVVVYRVNR